ncbi:MAG TPA: diacylglycerol kinase family protein [Chthoniobacterales bacterium]
MICCAPGIPGYAAAMRALLIINPESGDHEPTETKVERILAALSGAPFSVEVAYTELEKTAADLTREAVAAGFDVVLAGGGDGTVSEVARELIHQRAALGVVPIGTFNNIARSLEIPADIEPACHILRENHVVSIDVGLANGTKAFFEAAGAGLDAALFPLGEEIKGGQWTRWLDFLRTAFHFDAPRFLITFDRPIGETLPPGQRRIRSKKLLSRTLHRRALLLVAANGPYYGSGFTVAPTASMHDGKLTLSLYRRFTKWELLRHFQSIFRGKRQYSAKIETFSAASIEIDSTRPVPVHVDGCPFGETPLTLTTLPQALRVLVKEKK